MPGVGAQDRRAVNWRKFRWAAGIWLGLIATVWLATGLMNLAPDPELPPPTWLIITVGVLGISAGVSFLIYNLLLLVAILMGYFRKP